MVDTIRIKKRMEERGVSQKLVAEVLKCKQPTVSQKLNNKRPLYLDEAWEIAKLLEIQKTDFCTYFFAEKVA